MVRSFDSTDAVSIILFILCGITLILNIHGLFMMFKTDKSFSLEKYVLISGIIEVILIVSHNFNIKDIVIDTIQALQILITLLISKKFLQLFLIFNKSKKINNTDNEEDQQKEEDVGKHIYNSYFWILSIICVTLVILSCIIDFLCEEGSPIDVYVDFINDVICFIISIILFIFSMIVKKRMSEILIEQYNENKLIDEQQKQFSAKNEIFLSTRQTQIICISLGNLFTDFFEFVLSFLEAFVFKDVNRAKLSMYGLLNEYSLWLSTFLNYIAFYFIVRNSFNIQYVHYSQKHKNIVITKTLIEKNKDDEKKETSDIDKYLRESSGIPNKVQTYDEEF